MSSSNNPFDLGATVKGFSQEQEVFGRYTLKKIIGRGGMGVVWSAYDTKLDEMVALKFLPENVRMDEASLRDLVRETKRSRELTHPNIVRIHDIAEDDASAAIVMEYVDGETLQEGRYKRPDEVFTVEELRGVIEQCAKALDFSHSHAKIVHRDLKPSNIMLSRNGAAKIADFGVARSLCDTKSRMTMIGNSAGTMAYMSPQQLMGERPQASDDIYALGATIYELLVGRPPFHSGDITMQIMHKQPHDINEERAIIGLEGIPENWAKGILACLAKKPEDRPTTCAGIIELIDSLEVVDLSQHSAQDITKSKPSPSTHSTTTAPPALKTSSSQEVNEGGKKKKPVALILCAVALLFLMLGGGAFLALQQGWIPSLDKVDVVKAVKGPNPWDDMLVQASQSKQDGDYIAALELFEKAREAGDKEIAPAEIEKIKKIEVPLNVGGKPLGADVYVNDKKVGELPYSGTVGIGTHTVSVKGNGYSILADSEEMIAKNTEELGISKKWLERHTGQLSVSANLYGTTHKLTLEHSAVGNEEEEGEYTDYENLPTGSYKLVSSYDGLDDVVNYIKIKEGDTEDASVKMKYGNWKISSNPSGASVYVDNQYKGRTPYQLDKQLPEGVSVKLQLKNFKTKAFSFSVPSDGSTYNVGHHYMKKRDPITLHVPSQYNTIQKAINSALDGDTIQIAAGEYTEKISISNRKNLTIKGAGSWRTTIKHSAYSGSDTHNVFHIWRCSGIVVDGINVKHVGSNNGKNSQPVVLNIVESKDMSFRNVTVQNSVGFGLYIEASKVKLISVVSKYNTWAGCVIVGENVDVAIDKSSFYSNKSGLISHSAVKTTGWVTVNNSYFYGNKRNGVLRGKGKFRLSVLNSSSYRNKNSGFLISGSEFCKISKCSSYDNNYWGIFASDGFSGTIDANKCYRNTNGGIGVRGRTSHPSITNNKSFENKASGISIEVTTKCRKFSDNTAWSNGKNYKDINRSATWK